jgi:hypothetical protein
VTTCVPSRELLSRYGELVPGGPALQTRWSGAIRPSPDARLHAETAQAGQERRGLASRCDLGLSLVADDKPESLAEGMARGVSTFCLERA